MKRKYPVRLAATGAYLFDGDYPFAIKEYWVNNTKLSFHKTHWLAERMLTDAERENFLRMVAENNAKQERDWMATQEKDRREHFIGQVPPIIDALNAVIGAGYKPTIDHANAANAYNLNVRVHGAALAGELVNIFEANRWAFVLDRPTNGGPTHIFTILVTAK